MIDKLIVHDLIAECRIGVSDWERAKAQHIWIDLELAIDATKAAAGDDVRQAIDYGHLVTAVKRHAEQTSVHLLETLAEGIARLILKEFRVDRVMVRLKKRALPGVDYAAVEVSRPVPQ